MIQGTFSCLSVVIFSLHNRKIRQYLTHHATHVLVQDRVSQVSTVKSPQRVQSAAAPPVLDELTTLIKCLQSDFWIDLHIYTQAYGL